MKSDVALLCFAVVMLTLFAGVGLIEHMTQAEAVAEQLSSRLGVDEDILRFHLEEVLRRHVVRRVLIYAAPWTGLVLLLAVRVVIERKRQKLQ